MKKIYQPSKKILENYADVMVNFAIGGGKGLKKGEIVHLVIEEAAKPLFIEIRKAIWKAGGHIILDYKPSNDDQYNVDQDFYIHTEGHQLEFFPANYFKGIIDQIDHSVNILSYTNLKSLQKIDSKKIIQRSQIFKPWKDWRNEKENSGKFTWTLAQYGTEASAKEAGMSLKEYWNQIIKACYLNEKNPIAKWRSVTKSMNKYMDKLNKMEIERVHIKGADVDLHIKIGADRKWNGGRGANIPSFEIFTSPDYRDVNGFIKFNQPLYTNGNLIEGIELEFVDGIIVKSKASKNEKLLKEMIAVPGANRIGEFSMTDKRFSKITRFMASTLYDENVGGKYGNCHIAIGNAYSNCLKGDISKISKNKWKKLGFNSSMIHSDIITTTDRTITAYLKNDKKVIIFKNGQFCL
jgi:aminopeptidase